MIFYYIIIINYFTAIKKKQHIVTLQRYMIRVMVVSQIATVV